MSKGIFIAIIFLLTIPLSGQVVDDRLANQYYATGEYEKAAELYKGLWEKDKRRGHYFDRYITSLVEAGHYEEAEKSVDGRIRSEGEQPGFLIQKASIFRARGESDKAEAIYRKAIDELPADIREIQALGYAFQSNRQYDLAMETFEKGSELIGDSIHFANQLRSLAQYANDKDRLIRYSLLSLVQNDQNAPAIKIQLQRNLQEEDHSAFQKQLFIYIQSYPNRAVYPELLEWSYLQERNYAAALRQSRALDRQYDEDGRRVFQLGQMANNNGEYETAMEAFQFIIDQKSENSPFYLSARSEYIRSKKNKLISEDGSMDELKLLEKEYHDLIEDYHHSPNIAFVILELARFQNQYLKNSPLAKASLEKLIATPGVSPTILAHAKLELGDLWLLEGERWEATLLYSQVDKDFPDEDLGHLARYRNALLSFYVGDFEWAQQQFDILKSATHRMIANDAIDRSVFIIDNLNLDTTAHPLLMYAEAELKIFQRRYDEAFEQLQILINLYDGHGLMDDVLYLKATTFESLGRTDEAVELYFQIAANYPEEIRADNSIYALARIYEEKIKDIPTAAKLYEKLFIEFDSSTFAVDARKKYRELLERVEVESLPEDDPIEAYRIRNEL